MENSLKGLLLAAGVIITCIVIGLGFYIAREARDTAANSTGQISKLNAEFTESDKTMYDGMNVSGSEVVNVINKFKNDTMGIVVSTNAGATTYYGYNISGGIDDSVLESKSNSNVKDAQKISNKNYINPNAQFSCNVLRDKNRAIVGLKFTQNV